MSDSSQPTYCAYVFYTTNKNESFDEHILDYITAKNIHTMCDAEHGVLYTRGIICTSDGKYTLTTKGATRLAVSTPAFTAGVKVYAVAAAIAGITQPEDTIQVSTLLTQQAVVPAGVDLVITINTDN